MNKIVTLVLGLFVGLSASANYLYWTIGTDGLTSTGTDKYTFNNHQVVGFQVRENTGSASSVLASNVWVPSQGTETAVAAPVVPSYAGVDLWAVTDATKDSGYTYIIEVVGYDNAVYGDKIGVLAYTEIASPTIITDLKSTDSMRAAVTAWTGTPAYAAPEPTGAMLMLVGMALLGLKRRKA